jgi:hypothetical protein
VEKQISATDVGPAFADGFHIVRFAARSRTEHNVTTHSFFFFAITVDGFFLAGILSMLRFSASMMSITWPPWRRRCVDYNFLTFELSSGSYRRIKTTVRLEYASSLRTESHFEPLSCVPSNFQRSTSFYPSRSARAIRTSLSISHALSGKCCRAVAMIVS